MALGKIDDLSTTGWIFQGSLQEPGYGYIVRNLMHDMHPFAKEIRIEQVQIAGDFQRLSTGIKSGRNGNFQYQESFKLGPPTMTRTMGPDLVRPSSGHSFSDPRGFYSPQLVALTKYEMHNVFGEANQSLGIEYSLMFTTYTKDTLHDPTGILKATRVYPVINFLSPVPTNPLSDPKKRISTIRVILRVELALNGVDYSKEIDLVKTMYPKLSSGQVNALALKRIMKLANSNQAGVWVDHDDPTDGSELARRISESYKWPGYMAFAQAEKPLLWEVAGSGVLEGHSITTRKKKLWDNFHQWQGAFNFEQELKEGEMPPSPGMPYAAHLHWRWAAAAYKGGFFLGPGGKQFGGIGGAGGPMIDPRLRDQDLNFAVTRRSGFEPSGDIWNEYYQNNKHAFGIQDTLENLFSQFSGKKKKPRSIWKGDNLVLWLDFTARSNHLTDMEKANANPFEGAFFVNGIFFAHEPLSVMPLIGPIGASKPQIITSWPTHKWDRL